MDDAFSPIEEFLRGQNLDIREFKALKDETGISPRFIDQKVTPDVLYTMSRTVVQYSQHADEFTIRDIWHSPEFKNNLRRYGKPLPDDVTAVNEYNKFVGQPLKSLTYAGVLSERSGSKGLVYRVANQEVLRFIAGADENAALFLVSYLEEVLYQSGLSPWFKEFRNSDHSPDDLARLKREFGSYMQSYTGISHGKTFEPNRIFPKVLNPLASHWGTPGISGGRVSKFPQTFADLMYNSVNWRDRGKKAKSQSRATAKFQTIQALPTRSDSKVKREVRDYHDWQSEMHDRWNDAVATQVHHIIPKSRAGQFSDVRENLITLTPNQHNLRAHPQNRTLEIDPHYQLDLLMSKSISIAHSIDERDGFYQLSKFRQVVEHVVGHGLPEEASMPEIREAISRHRKTLIRPSMA